MFLHFLEYPIYLLDETKIESEKFLVKENGDFPNHMAFVQKKDSDYLVILDPKDWNIEESKITLSKILLSISIKMTEIDILCTEYKLSLDLFDRFQKIIIFGTQETELNSKYKVFTLKSGPKALWSDDLMSLNADKSNELKKKLWQALKDGF